MAIRVLPLGSTKVVELSSDPDKGTANATRFTIRCLDSRQIGWLKDKFVTFSAADAATGGNGEEAGSIMDAEAKQHVPINDVAFATCSLGIAGWENLFDADGKAVEFKETPFRLGSKTYQSVMPRLLNLINPADLSELRNHIDAFSAPTKEELGK